MTNTTKKLPKSRKALEYRVFWLERKLSFLKQSEKRDVNAQKIAVMQDSPIKEWMHLNNEFQRANDKAHVLKNLTEELNQNALRINERSERMNEVTAGTITDAERLNRQTRRSLESSKKINHTSENLNSTSNALIDESKYLSKLTRTQHVATDRLNQKTRSLNIDSLQSSTTSIKLNRDIDATHKDSLVISQQICTLKDELEPTKVELQLLAQKSAEINAKGNTQIQKIIAIEQKAENVTTQSQQTCDQASVQFNETRDLNIRSKTLILQSESNAEQFLDIKDQINTHVEQNQNEHEKLRENVKRDITLLEMEAVSNLKGFNDHHGDIIKVELRDAIEKANSKLNDSVKHNAHLSLKIAQKSEVVAETLASRMTETLNKSQDLFDETAALNDTTGRLVKEGLALNVESFDLHGQCHHAIDEITIALEEIERIKTTVGDDTRELQCQTEELNAESKLLIKTGASINKQSLTIQKESINTQSLSQEINNHSLSLHQEIRVINQNFDQINTDNCSLVERLTALKRQLESLYEKKQHQLDETNQTNRQGKILNEDTTKLNAGAQVLNEQMLMTLNKTNTTLAESENINRHSLDLSKEVKEALLQLEFARDDVSQASADSRLAAAEARQVVEETMVIHTDLQNSSSEMKTLYSQASEEFVALESLKQESSEVADSSRDAYLQLKGCISQSRQINDDFMRGLEATTNAHKQTELSAHNLLEESKTLQADIRDMLSLRTGVKEFQSSIDECQSRLAQYGDELSLCKRSTSSHSGILGDYQSKIENYQSDLNQYRETITQFEFRVRKTESNFVDHDVRLDKLESHQDNVKDELLDRQLGKTHALEREIKSTIASNKLTLNEDLNNLKESMTNSLALLAEEIRAQLSAELDQKQKKQNEKILQNRNIVNDLNSEFYQLNQNITDEINALREESSEMLTKNWEFVQQQRALHQSLQRETTENREHHRQDLDEVNHKLGNYRTLVESKIDGQDKSDNQQSDLLKARLNNLEANIRNQQSSSPNKQSVEALSIIVDDLSHSLGDVVESNRTLKKEIAESEKRNKELIKYNYRLKSSVQEGEENLHGYSERLFSLENSVVLGEAKYQESIGALKCNETETKQTLQQMRMAMKDSTKAMRETQKTLQSFKHSQKQSEQPKKANWMENSKQAVLSSFFAVFLTSLAFVGYENVDASISSSTDEHITFAQSPLQIPKANKMLVLKHLSGKHQSKDHAWPVNFNMLDTQSIQYEPHHRGISISAELGDPVLAINDGIVLYSAKEIRGYGNVIVIQHDNELVSVYANNQFNYVNEGDTVQRGQLIGDIGQMFNQDKAGLYFEIRYMGNPEDPFNYLSHNIQPELLSMR
jgi:murein DD-endopeptidase MepM/ murein hydrolase activator NlpD